MRITRQSSERLVEADWVLDLVTHTDLAYRHRTVRIEHPSGPAARTDPNAVAVRVAVHTLGGEDGSALLLVHAAGFHGRVWAPVADELAADFRCFAPDLRGHGDSPMSDDDDLDWRGFADDVLATVDRLGLQRPYGAGHSSGATALLLAEQARPGTFRALYCYEPVVVPADPPLGRDPDNWLAERARGRRATFASREDALAHYATKPPLSTLRPEVLRLYVEHGLEEAGDATVRLKCRPDHEGRIYEMATAHDVYGRLAEVSCPVILARGEDSEAAGARQLAHLAGRLPNARTAALPGLGHFGPLEDPAAVGRSIRTAFTEGPPREADRSPPGAFPR